MAPKDISKKVSDKTRSFSTPYGDLTYTQLNERLANPLLHLLKDISYGKYESCEIDTNLITNFHKIISQDVIPEQAGKWRNCSVRVGTHYPPEPQLVPTEMWMYVNEIREKLKYISKNNNSDEYKIEILSFAEAKFLNIHPFVDFNGRTIRAFLQELLLRMDLPPFNLSFEIDSDEMQEYLSALREFDKNGNHFLLKKIWEKYRISKI